MRITNHLSTQQAIAEFAAVRTQLDSAQRKVSTGHRFTDASEDPAAAAGVMQNNTQTRAIEQYRRNIGVANRRVTLEESSVDQLTTLLIRAREIAVSQATDTATVTTRQTAGAEINQILAQAVQIANTKDGAEYVFGGDTSTTAPFAINSGGAAYTFTVAATPPVGARMVEIGAGQRVTAGDDGTRIFGSAIGGPLKALQDLAAALQGGTLAGVAATLGPINSEVQAAQDRLGEVGARANQLQLADSGLTALANQLASSTSDLRDIDLETAMTELVGRQTAYQAAMAATSRVMTLSLTDYLR